MKIKFKKQAFQTLAVESVTDCFRGQPRAGGIQYRVDPGRPLEGQPEQLDYILESGFRNNAIQLSDIQLLENMQAVQRRQNISQSESLHSDAVSRVNLDIEMETGTGKTYCYIKTMFELNRQYGWSKFIIVVPSIAIREGVHKSLQITAEHFLEEYGKQARFFIYNSRQLHNLESFSSDAGINIMIINVQAFASKAAANRRIYDELDDFQTRKPIDVISSNRPILILDEPQKLGGTATIESLKKFKALMVLRYSATHTVQHNKVHRLDALDAYNQKLVKKIAVRGISVKGFTGTNAYLYLESIQISSKHPPLARVEMEVMHANGIKREIRRIGKNDNLYSISGEMDQYQGFTVADIDAVKDTVTFTNGEEIQTGQASGDVNETTLRRIQIRETIKAHFEKEQNMFNQGIKVLSLFFIDEVAKYRRYDDTGEVPGEYAGIFEEEYNQQVNEVLMLEDTPYTRYLKKIQADKTHNGYFSIDRKTNRLVDPTTGKKSDETEDVDAYDLILKDKERLLSLDEPIRFIFSHSALREGWDNPNVFVICTLKHSDSTVSRRQEVGRGMRLSVNQDGDRMDNPSTVHVINVLTVIANESYKDFVAGLQKDISASLSERPRKANAQYFTDKILKTGEGDVAVTEQLANLIYRYLVKNDFTDLDDKITQTYHDAKKEEKLADLPPELEPYKDQVFQLIDSVFSDAALPVIDDERKAKINPLNDNFKKNEFKALWSKINRKAAYTVHFDSGELIKKCIKALDDGLTVSPLQYTIVKGEQVDNASYEDVTGGEAFKVTETNTEKHKASVHSAVKYDLIGKIAEDTQLTRHTIATILHRINLAIFNQFKTNPEDFIIKTGRIINEQKATMIIEHLAYDPIEDEYGLDIFTQEKPKENFSRAVKVNRHIYDYVFTDSQNEKQFVTELDTSREVVVYAKLPRGFYIPTPVGNYNPDWAIAFEEGKVRHIYFVAETKGSLSSMELREIEKSKIACARKFFNKITSNQVKYDVVDSYDKLIELVR